MVPMYCQYTRSLSTCLIFMDKLKVSLCGKVTLSNSFTENVSRSYDSIYAMAEQKGVYYCYYYYYYY